MSPARALRRRWRAPVGLRGLAWRTLALHRVAVTGASMSPTLRAGERLVTVPVLRPRVGDVVVLVDPTAPGRRVVKRVARAGRRTHGAAVYVIGDNPALSTDSRRWGPVPPGALRGRVWYRYAPPERAGVLRRSRVR